MKPSPNTSILSSLFGPTHQRSPWEEGPTFLHENVALCFFVLLEWTCQGGPWAAAKAHELTAWEQVGAQPGVPGSPATL